MSIVNTLLEKAVVAPKTEFMSFETRMPRPGIISAFQRDTDMVINGEEMKKLKKSLRRPVEIAVMNKKLFNVNTVRQINPTPDVADTARVPLVWLTKAFSFTVADALNEDNDISRVQEFRMDMFNAMKSVLYDSPNALEKNGAAYLASHAWANPPVSTVPGVNPGFGSYELKSVDYTLNAPVVMSELDLYGKFIDIANTSSLARRRRDAMFSKYNERDKEQYADDFSYYLSHEITPSPGAEETHYLCAANSLAFLNRVEYDAIRGAEDKDGHFEVVQDPFFGFQWGVYITKARADYSGAFGAGQERVVGTRYDFAADFSFLNAYSSVVGESPIVKFDGVPS